MALKVGDTIKVTCTSEKDNAWKVDPNGKDEATVTFIRGDGIAYAAGIKYFERGDLEKPPLDFMITVPAKPDAPAAPPPSAPDKE